MPRGGVNPKYRVSVFPRSTSLACWLQAHSHADACRLLMGGSAALDGILNNVVSLIRVLY